MSSTRKTKGTAAKLRKVPSKDFSIKRKPGCGKWITHKSGKGGPVGCGDSDSVSVYSAAGFIIVLSVNYAAGYVCVESFNKSGLDEVLFTDGRGLDAILPAPLSSHVPIKIAEAVIISAKG